jgi:hypothetical protein
MELAKVIDPKVYDELYESGDYTYTDPAASIYYPLFCGAAQRVREIGISELLEVGCGSGVLAEMVMQRGIRYHGFDLSPVGVEKAQRRNREGSFRVGDATDPQAYDVAYDGVLCCEVLEHIDRDLDAIGLWKSGAKVVCSVPNFDYPTHVRLFRNEREVVERYGGLIDIRKIQRFAKPIFVNRTPRSYLRSLRWLLMEGKFKRAAGLMGIRKFDWNTGWFLFSGVRR